MSAEQEIQELTEQFRFMDRLAARGTFNMADFEEVRRPIQVELGLPADAARGLLWLWGQSLNDQQTVGERAAYARWLLRPI